MEQLSSLDNALPQYILAVFLFPVDDSLHGLKSLILRDLNSHIVVVIICVLIDLVINNNFILFIPEVQEDTMFVAALGFAGEVLAVLNCSEEDLHPMVDLVEGLSGGGGTMKAVAAA